MKKTNVDILVYSVVLSLLIGIMSMIIKAVIIKNNASISQNIADKNFAIKMIINGEMPSLSSEKVKLCSRNELEDKLIKLQSKLQPITDNQREVLKAESVTHDQVSQQR